MNTVNLTTSRHLQSIAGRHSALLALHIVAAGRPLEHGCILAGTCLREVPLAFHSHGAGETTM